MTLGLSDDSPFFAVPSVTQLPSGALFTLCYLFFFSEGFPLKVSKDALFSHGHWAFEVNSQLFCGV